MDREEIKFRNGKIVRGEEPLNLEMPFEKLDGFLTPAESFYVRCHFPIPAIEKRNWRLRIMGEVERPIELSYDELLKLETRTLPVTLECAGNSRNLLNPKVKGVAWGLGAVGNAEWTGVPLSVVLNRAGVKSAAYEVILEGADSGPVEEAKKPAGDVRFARSVPLAKAQKDVLLAYKINGQELPREHGFPLRAIVPGWYAVASVKWLERVIVTDKPFNGFYQTIDYAYWESRGQLPELLPIQRMQIKAEIARPMANEIVATGTKVEIQGAAWAGESDVTRVEVSTDSGKTWNDATLIGEARRNAWRLWEYEWHTPSKPGATTLLARATDSDGRTQSVDRDLNRGTYMINHLLPVPVEVR